MRRFMRVYATRHDIPAYMAIPNHSTSRSELVELRNGELVHEAADRGVVAILDREGWVRAYNVRTEPVTIHEATEELGGWC